jgi:cytochrome c553
MDRLIRMIAALPLALALLAPAGNALAAGDAAAGKEKAQQCAVCHGIDGLAKRPDAPHLAGESDLYLSKQLRAFRSGERQNEMMSIIAEALSDQDIADLAAWYSAIKVTVELPQAP